MKNEDQKLNIGFRFSEISEEQDKEAWAKFFGTINLFEEKTPSQQKDRLATKGQEPYPTPLSHQKTSQGENQRE